MENIIFSFFAISVVFIFLSIIIILIKISNYFIDKFIIKDVDEEEANNININNVSDDVKLAVSASAIKHHKNKS